jgi:IS1 family transposase
MRIEHDRDRAVLSQVINVKDEDAAPRVGSPYFIDERRLVFPLRKRELVPHSAHQSQIKKMRRFGDRRKTSVSLGASDVKRDLLWCRIVRQQSKTDLVRDNVSWRFKHPLPVRVHFFSIPSRIKICINQHSKRGRVSDVVQSKANWEANSVVLESERSEQFNLDFNPWPVRKFEFLGENGSLRLNRPQSRYRSTYTPPTNPYEQAGEESGGSCEDERPSLNARCVIFIFLCFGGLFLVFGPGVSFDNKWGRRCAYLGLGSCWLGLLFWFLSNVFPYTWGLPPQWLPARQNPCRHSNYRQQRAHRETVSQKLLAHRLFLYYAKYMANVLSTDKQIGIIGALCEGSSIRSIERTTGVHRDTIMRLGVKVGKGCTALMDAKMRNLDCHRLEMDEIWGYVGKKEKHLRPGDDPQLGNVWTFCAIDADTKLVPTFRVGSDRDAQTATAFMLDVADRMKNRVQISTDGLSAYVEAIDWAFGRNVDYGQIIKVYGIEESVEAQRRYSAPKITSTEKKAVFGRPDFDLISTSYVERLNATTRLHMKRLARLTHAFSKKRENFEAAVGLHFAYYNFVRRHTTLRCTPAMAAGVERSFWSVGELLGAIS